MNVRAFFALALSVLLTGAELRAAELLIGTAEADITPDRPVSLAGQFHQRISKGVASRCMASVLAFESRAAGKPGDQAIIVALDVIRVPVEVQQAFRAAVAARLPGFDTNKLLLTATHTHTGPTLDQSRFNDYGDAMQPKEYVPFMIERAAVAAEKAWARRKPGAVAWGLGHAVVGCNRRMTYADGSAVMLGRVDVPDFRGFEGWEDHSLDVLCCVDGQKRLAAVMLAVPCPSQTVDMSYEVSADYWQDVRAGLREKYGAGLVVLGCCAPAGDMYPLPLLRRAAEGRMQKLRKLTRGQELARRIVAAFDETWEAIRNDLRADVPFSHRVERFELPGRRISEKEYREAKKGFEDYSKRDLKNSEAYSRQKWFQWTLDRYAAQDKGISPVRMEVHVLRLGDLAVATSPFELFVDYAMRIQGRSAAGQTMLVQLASPADVLPSSYLPSQRAVDGGGYSAVPQSNPVGPDGGQMLVDRTVEVIKGLFGK